MKGQLLGGESFDFISTFYSDIKKSVLVTQGEIYRFGIYCNVFINMVVVVIHKTYLEHIGGNVVVQEECSVHQEIWEVVHCIPNAKNLQ